MTKRLFAIAFIFACTSIAWFVLGSTIYMRTFERGPALREKVASGWGAPQTQTPPRACYKRPGKTEKETVTEWLPLDRSRVKAGLHLEHRQKGLLWYSIYTVAFEGVYSFHNPSGQDQDVTFALEYPSSQAIYDDFVFLLDGAPMEIENGKNSAVGKGRVGAGKTIELKVGYRSQGLDKWVYRFGGEVAQVRDFQLRMTTDFRDIDFPDRTLSPTTKRETAKGWDLEWQYKNLVAGYSIGMAMPEKLQPGPLAGNICYFAPVSLLFFFFLMFLITVLRGIDLHPMNCFFLACAFFAFHLLLAYLVDHISIHAAFLIASAVSVFLVVSYLRLVVGIRFAAVEAASAQLIYLVLFSYAFFFKGFTGLAVTIGSVLTLFVVMQMTGRIKWTEKFAAPKVSPPPPPSCK
jgi:hypothetical protein